MSKRKPLSYDQMLKLAKQVVEAETNLDRANDTFTYKGVQMFCEDAQEVLREEMREFAGHGDYYTMKENTPVVFKLISEVVDEILPKNIDKEIGQWAEIKTFAQGDKATFTQRLGHARAKNNFITKAGLAGTYDVFRLDRTSMDIPTDAVGGAAQIGFEEYLDGKVDFSEVMMIVLNGIEDKVYLETRKAMEATAAMMKPGTNNKRIINGFHYQTLNDLLATARAYGDGVQILASQALASKFTNHPSFTSDADRNDMRNQGYIGKIAGADVIILPQSFTDNNNDQKVYQDRYAFILPVSGQDNRIVKVALEGQTIVREYDNRDLSVEMQAYKKMGVAMISDAPHICIYEDASIPYVEHVKYRP